MNRFALLTTCFAVRRTRKFLVWFTVYSLWFIAVSPQLSTVNSQLSTLNLNETKLATIPEDYQVREILFSNDGRQVVYQARKENAQFIVVDNNPGMTYVAVRFISLSPDGKRIAYAGRRDGKDYLVLDGREGKPYDDVTSTTFSPDGTLVACEVEDNKKWSCMLSDGEKEIHHGTHYSWSYREPVFSPDNHLLLYELGERKTAERITFITDTRTGKIIKERIYGFAGSFLFSSDSSRLLYEVKKEGKYFLILNNFSLNEEREIAVPYEWIGLPGLSSDGRNFAYVAQREGKKFVVAGNWDFPAAVKEHPAYDTILKPVFNADGSMVAYPASKGGKWFIVSGAADGSLVREGPAYEMVVTPVFNSNSSQLIYRAKREGKRFIVIADTATGGVVKEGPACDEVWPTVIGPDGKSVCYGARIGRELWWKVQLLP